MPDITSNLIGWWKLDDGSGSTAADASGNSNTGTLVNSPSWVAGHIGSGAIQVAGRGAGAKYISTPNQSQGTHQNFTWAAWIYPTDITGQSGHNIFLGGDGANCWLEITSSGYLSFHAINNADHTYTGAAIPINTWTHVAVTAQDPNGPITLYINGSQVKQDTGAGIWYNNVKERWFLGTLGNVAGNYGFIGNLDDVRIYERELTATDIAALYAYTDNAGVTADASITLAGDAVSADGSIAVQAALSKSLADDTVSADASVSLTASLSKTFDDDTVASAASVLVTADAAATLADDTVSASGATLVIATLDATLEGDALNSSAGSPAINADCAIVLGDDTVSSGCSVVVSATSTATLADDSCAAAASVAIDASLSLTLEDDTLTASIGADFVDGVTRGWTVAARGISFAQPARPCSFAIEERPISFVV